MSWRVVAAVLVAVFAALLVSMTTADPLRVVTEALISASGGESGVASQAAAGVRAYGNLIMIIVFGVMAWGLWYVLRRESTRGGL